VVQFTARISTTCSFLLAGLISKPGIIAAPASNRNEKISFKTTSLAKFGFGWLCGHGNYIIWV
jgi:hypothetical protein